MFLFELLKNLLQQNDHLTELLVDLQLSRRSGLRSLRYPLQHSNFSRTKSDRRKWPPCQANKRASCLTEKKHRCRSGRKRNCRFGPPPHWDAMLPWSVTVCEHDLSKNTGIASVTLLFSIGNQDLANSMRRNGVLAVHCNCSTLLPIIRFQQCFFNLETIQSGHRVFPIFAGIIFILTWQRLTNGRAVRPWIPLMCRKMLHSFLHISNRDLSVAWDMYLLHSTVHSVSLVYHKSARVNTIFWFEERVPHVSVRLPCTL